MPEITPQDAGTMISEAVAAAREFPRPIIEDVIDPRDATAAPVVISAHGVSKVEPSIFDAYRVNPLARIGTAHLTTLESFIDHTLRFQQSNSAIFACDDMTKAKLTTVFDYHPPVSDLDEARHLRHRAEYAFPFSDEWKAWNEQNAKPMSMADFAAFLEDRVIDVVADGAPTTDAAKDFVKAVGGTMASPSKLIELARNLQVYENSVLKEARNLSSGEGQLTFDSQHVDADGKPLSVPNMFMICIPIFARSPDFFRLLARLRYRKANNGVLFWYEIWRADLAFEQAFNAAIDKVRTETSLPTYIGSPEQ